MEDGQVAQNLPHEAVSLLMLDGPIAPYNHTTAAPTTVGVVRGIRAGLNYHGYPASAMTTDLPAQLGFHMPAEWEPHEATWIAWPHQRDDWPGKFPTIPWVYAEIVYHLAQSETVRILVNDAAAERRAQGMLRKRRADLGRVEFFHAPTDRVWTRDYAPIFVRNAANEVAVTDWHFNAWAKYDNWRLDDAVPALIAERFGLRRWQPAVGGRRASCWRAAALTSMARGLLLTTEECLLSPVQARNPDLLARGPRAGAGRLSWRSQGAVARSRHPRRRHARPRR